MVKRKRKICPSCKIHMTKPNAGYCQKCAKAKSLAYKKAGQKQCSLCGHTKFNHVVNHEHYKYYFEELLKDIINAK